MRSYINLTRDVYVILRPKRLIQYWIYARDGVTVTYAHGITGTLSATFF